MLAYTYPLLDIFWTMLWFFCFFIYIWLLIIVFTDIFRSHDMGGWAKAGWVIFVIVLPFLGIFVYLIAEGKGMGERNVQQAQTAQADMDAYVRSVAGSTSPTDQIAQAKQLLDTGTITQAEFDQIKARALAT